MARGACQDIGLLCAAFAEAVDAPNGFGKDFQSFDDCLFGGLGLESPCEVIWRDHRKSRAALNCEAMAAWCRKGLAAPTQAGMDEGGRWFREALAKAEAGEYSLFDFIVETINSVEERSGGDVQLKLTLA